MNPPFHEGVKTSAAAGAGIHDFGNTPSETKMPSNGTSTTPLACRQCGRHSPTGWTFSWLHPEYLTRTSQTAPVSRPDTRRQSLCWTMESLAERWLRGGVTRRTISFTQQANQTPGTAQLTDRRVLEAL